MYYIYSTLTADNAYAVYAPSDSDKAISVISRSILIKGGHGLANKHFVTAQGVVTEVTEEEMEILKNDAHFKQHVSNGFITFEKKKLDAAEVAKSMEDRDASAPVIPADYVEEKDAEGNMRKVYKPKGKKNV